MARILKDFKTPLDEVADAEDTKYHHQDQKLSSKKAFQTDVKMQLVEVMTEMENPFCGDFEELVTLDTRDCVDQSVVMTVQH